jgi:hypothetical protein
VQFAYVEQPRLFHDMHTQVAASREVLLGKLGKEALLDSPPTLASNDF